MKRFTTVSWATAVVAVGMLTAAPAQALPDRDNQYLNQLDNGGITYDGDPAAAVQAGHEICGRLSQGYTYDEVTNQLVQGSQSSHPNGDGLTVELGHVVMDAAITVYCPRERLTSWRT